MRIRIGVAGPVTVFCHKLGGESVKKRLFCARNCCPPAAKQPPFLSCFKRLTSWPKFCVGLRSCVLFSSTTWMLNICAPISTGWGCSLLILDAEKLKDHVNGLATHHLDVLRDTRRSDRNCPISTKFGIFA